MTLKVGPRTVVMNGALRIIEILGEPMPRFTRAAKQEIERLHREHRALLEACPAYAEHKSRLETSRKLRARNRRAFDLAWFAVLDAVPLKELLKLVEKQWRHHTIAHVMVS